MATTEIATTYADPFNEKTVNDKLPAPQEQGDIAPQVWEAALQGRDVAATDLLPDDKWADVPYLPKGSDAYMVDQQIPFLVLGIAKRTSEYGPIWKLVVALDNEVFSYVLGGNEPYRNDRMEKIQKVLMAGARSVGPFIMIEQDTGKGNPYRDIRAVPIGHKAKTNKTTPAKK